MITEEKDTHLPESSIIREYNNPQERKIQKLIFDKDKYNQIISKDLDLKKNDIFKNDQIKKLFQKEKIEYYVISDQEEAIDVRYTQEKDRIVNLPLYNQRIYENEISKIPDKHKNKIKNIRLAATDIIVKAYFHEGIDTPLELILCDDRIRRPKEGSIVATLVGNLIYQQVKFKKIINYSISTLDENMEKSLVLYWNINGIEMKEGSKIFSIRIRNLYVLSEKHIVNNKKKYQNNIIIESLFPDVIKENDNRLIKYEKTMEKMKRQDMITYSKRFGNIIPYDKGKNIQIEENTEEERQLQPKGRNTNVLHIPKIIHKQLMNQFHIIGRINKNYYAILIDTGAANSYISPEIVNKENIQLVNRENPLIAKNWTNNSYKFTENGKFMLEIQDINRRYYKIQIEGLVDTIPLLEREEQILLGINILEELQPYSITQDYLSITVNFREIKLPRIKQHYSEVIKTAEQMSQLRNE